jgi:hypothetical protein
MSVAGEIAQDFLRATEGVLAVDHPLCVPQRREIGGVRADNRGCSPKVAAA